jgi:ribulose 1,5-bisphosphate synthetase/thiazole synthase
VSLRNLSGLESRRYLRESGVDTALHDRLVAITYGHPLGLSLLADVVIRGGMAAVLRLSWFRPRVRWRLATWVAWS